MGSCSSSGNVVVSTGGSYAGGVFSISSRPGSTFVLEKDKEAWFETKRQPTRGFGAKQQHLHTGSSGTASGSRSELPEVALNSAAETDTSRGSSRRTTTGDSPLQQGKYSPGVGIVAGGQPGASKTDADIGRPPQHPAVARAILLSGGKGERKGEVPKPQLGGRSLMIDPHISFSESSEWSDTSPNSKNDSTTRPDPTYGTPSFSSRGRNKSKDVTPRKGNVGADHERPWDKATPKSRFLSEQPVRSRSLVGMENLLAGGAIIRFRPGTPAYTAALEQQSSKSNQKKVLPFSMSSSAAPPALSASAPAASPAAPAADTSASAQRNGLQLPGALQPQTSNSQPSQSQPTSLTPPAQPVGAQKKGKHTRPRSNSTSSIFVNCTVFVPNDKENIDAVAIIISQCIVRDPVPCRADFNESSVASNGTFKLEYRTDPPYLSHFMRHMVKYGEISSDCIAIALVYIERFLSSKTFLLTPFNVRPILMLSLLTASKVWDDRGVWNIDCAEMFPDLGSLKTINAWERVFLESVDYDLTVSAELYTRYYFLLLMNAPRIPILPEPKLPQRTVRQALMPQKEKLGKAAPRSTMSFDTMELNKSQACKQMLPPSLAPADRFVSEARRQLKMRVIS